MRSSRRPLSKISFRTRLTVGLLIAALLPVLTFGLLVQIVELTPLSTGVGADVFLVATLAIALLCVPLAVLLGAELPRPLRNVARNLDRVSAGEQVDAPTVAGDDELARLSESHARLAADLRRRSTQVSRILEVIPAMRLSDDVDALATRAAADAVRVFELIDAKIHVATGDSMPDPEVIPGEPRPLRAPLRAGDETLGVLLGWLSATRAWSGADQDLFELYASQVAVNLRNAQLFGRIEAQNSRLIELDAAKDDFLRGVSHNLQSPLASIRAHAEHLAQDRPDRRLEIIAEQSERLSRIVRQLLTMARLESGTLEPHGDVISLAARTRRAWEALGASGVAFVIDDHSNGWLAIADADQLDQVLWALLDNAVKYGEGSPIAVDISPVSGIAQLRLTIADSGPGIPAVERGRLFGRFSRGPGVSVEGGSGLGLYVSRELCRAMGGELELASVADGGAAFSIYLPAEHADET